MPMWGRPVMDHNGSHSMPGTPYPVESRLPDFAAEIFKHVRIDLEKELGRDYFNFSPRGSTGLDIRPRSPYVVPHERHEQNMFRHRSQTDLSDFVHRNNLYVSLVNAQIPPQALHAEVHPKLCTDGTYPKDFPPGATFETLRMMESSQLDRIMQAYGLPRDARSLYLDSNVDITTPILKHAKHCTLFEYLGAMQIASHLMMKFHQYRARLPW